MARRASDLAFKFKYVLGGAAQGFFATKAQATGEALALGEERLALADIHEAEVRDNRIILTLRGGVDLTPELGKHLIEGRFVVLEVYGVGAQELERVIERACSKHAAERVRERYEAEGKGHLFQTQLCPVCEATVDTSEMEEASHVYCQYCDTVFTPTRQVVTNGEVYRCCGECDYFGQVKGYTEFYFYFLLVVYGFRHSRIHACVNCANKRFWKLLLANLIFVLGVPNAIWFKIKTLTGRDPKLAELAAANAKAQAGDLRAAQAAYQALERKVPGHPGLAYNEGIARLRSGGGGEAVECFLRSLKSCPNYLPSLRVLARIQRAVAEAEAREAAAG